MNQKTWVLILLCIILIFIRGNHQTSTKIHDIWQKYYPPTQLDGQKEKHLQELQDLIKKSQLYQESHQDQLYIKTLQKIIIQFSNTPEAINAKYNLVQAYIKLEKWPSAIRFLQQLDPEEKNPKTLALLAHIEERMENLDKAYQKYHKLLQKGNQVENIQQVQENFESLVSKMILSPQKDIFSFIYIVQAGDNLYNIAQMFHNTVEYLSYVNTLSSDSLQIGQRLKVLKPENHFSVIVDVSQKKLFLKLNQQIIKTYPVALGGIKTPIGKFVIETRLVDPVWFHKGQVIPTGDPSNILGTRWLGFSHDIGIHGSISEKPIDEQVSNGCVRMYNKDVEELFMFLNIGDQVLVTE